MIVNNQFNNPLLELKGDKVIIKRTFGVKVLEKEKIHAIYLDKYYRLKMLYEDKPLIFNMSNVKVNDEFKLHQIIDRLNKDNNVFINNQSNTIRYYSIFFIIMLLGTIARYIYLNDSYEKITISIMIIVGLIIVFYLSNPKLGSVIYNYKIGVIQYYDWKGSKKIIIAKDSRYNFADDHIKNDDWIYIRRNLNKQDKRDAINKGFIEYYDFNNIKRKIEVYEKIYSFKKKNKVYKFKVKGANRSINTCIIYPNTYKYKIEELCDKE